MERWLSWSKAHAWKVCEPETVPRVRIPLSPPEKSINLDTRLVLFSTKSVFRRNKSASQMKSLRDEILLRKDKKTDLISSKSFDFDFIQTSLDFIVLCTITHYT